jgi:hypothetical protein
MVKRLNDRIKRYGIDQSSTARDGTGLEDVFISYLPYPVEKMILSGRPRSDIFSNYISVIERHAVISPYIEALHGRHVNVSVDDLYGDGHPPDGFAAGAMA